MHERDHARELGAVRSGLAATALLCVVELVGGYLTNSLALISDAAHMFTDMAALGLTLFAIWICSRPASETKTFGYYRAEILAALVNGVVLWLIVVFIVAEAWRRLHDPPPVSGRGLLALALAGLAVNAAVALRLRTHRGRSLNLRGAYLHVLSDLLGSFGAVAALMEAVPAHIDVEALRRSLERVPGTDEVHDLHVWSLTTGRYALSAHAVVAVDHDADDAILAAMAAICAREFHIEHVTIQIEHESRRAAEPAH